MRYKSVIVCFALLALLLVALYVSKDKFGTPRPAAIFEAPVYAWTTTPHEPVVIWTREHDLDRVFMQRAFARYQALTGNKIHVVTFPQTGFEENVAEALRGDGDKPDVLLSYGGAILEPFDPEANFYDFSNAPWVKDLTLTSLNQTIYRGKVMGLPHWEASISGIIYNKNLFARLGIALPTNQQEFFDVCEALKSNGITPLYLPFKVPSMLLYQFPMDSILEDAALLADLNSGKRSYAHIPAMKDMVQWYRTMAERGYLGESYRYYGWEGMSPALSSGCYAMLIAWDTWLYTDFQGDASHFGLMPAFMGTPAQGTFEGPNQALLIVNKNSPRLDAALNLITFLADPYNYNEAFSGIYTAPVFKNQVTSISTPQYVAAERLIEKHFRDSTAWLRVRGFSQLDAVYIQKYMTAQPGYTLEQCLLDMDREREARVGLGRGNKGAGR